MNIETLQFYGLALQARLPVVKRVKRYPLIAPPCLLRTDGAIVSHIYKDVFVHKTYALPPGIRKNARILDAGAHVGLASMFFLDQLPKAELITVEANPKALACLRDNLDPWRKQVQIIPKAISIRNGTTSYFLTISNVINVNAGMTNRERSGEQVQEFKVPCFDVADLLTEPFDFMKLDVEGAEYEILTTERINPSYVHEMVVEFHDVDLQPQRFLDIAKLLEGRGYRLMTTAFEPTTAVRLLTQTTDSAVLGRFARAS